MSNNCDKEKNDDIEEAHRCLIIPYEDNFNNFFNSIVNPDALTNCGEDEYHNNSNASKGTVNLSYENETVQNIRSNDYYKKED